MDRNTSTRLRTIFERSGITRYQLSKDSGVSLSTINRWAEGETELGIHKVDKVADALGWKIELKRKGRS